MPRQTTAQIRRTLARSCAAMGVPANGVFELTPRCNLRCSMCYVRMTPEQMAPMGRELTAKEWLSLAQEAVDAGMLFLLITGGEPTLRTDFLEIYEGLAQMGLSISINTNGTLLSSALRALWHRLPPAQVNVTLYGTCEEDYAALCGDGSAFLRVVDTLRWLRKEGILIHLNTTFTPENAKSCEKIEEFALSLGLELRATTYCFPPIRRNDCADFSRLSPEEAAALTVLDIFCREGREGVSRRAAVLSAPPQAGCDLEIGEAMQCTAGKSQFWIAWNGAMTPCGMMTAPQTNPIETKFNAAWEKLRGQTAEIHLCPDCTGCAERGTCMNCAAVTFAETGRFDGKPEYMCAYNRAYRSALKQISASTPTPMTP